MILHKKTLVIYSRYLHTFCVNKFIDTSYSALIYVQLWFSNNVCVVFSIVVITYIQGYSSQWNYIYYFCVSCGELYFYFKKWDLSLHIVIKCTKYWLYMYIVRKCEIYIYIVWIFCSIYFCTFWYTDFLEWFQNLH